MTCMDIIIRSQMWHSNSNSAKEWIFYVVTACQLVHSDYHSEGSS